MELTFTNIFMAILAGLASIASPCVLPVIPIILTGTASDHKHRPTLIVLGLSFSFMLMGVLTSLFSGMFAGVMPTVEKIASLIIILFGFLLLFDINIFKRLSFFSKLNYTSTGRWSGFVLGLTLGVIWIPCVGPMLSGVLTLVAAKGTLSAGLVLLFFYSLGFSIPMLFAGYASQAFRQNVRFINQRPIVVRMVSGTLLIAFGLYIFNSGMLAFSGII